MTTQTIRRALRKLQAQVTGSGECTHLAPVALLIEPDGTLRRVPAKCRACELPRRIWCIAYAGEVPDTITVPDWFAFLLLAVGLAPFTPKHYSTPLTPLPKGRVE